MESETEPRELSAEFVFAFPVSSMLGFLSLPLCWFFFFFFFHIQLPPWELSPSWAFCCAWLLLCGGRAEIVSARLNPSHGTIYVRGVCNFLGSVSLQQKFEATDGPVLQPRVISLVATKNVKRRTDQCYSSVSFGKQRKIHPRGARAD